MLGTDFYTAVSTLIDGFSMDSVLFYQFLNVARSSRELERPFMRLRKYQFSQTVGPVSNNPTAFPPTAKVTVPSDFMYLNEDGIVTLYDNNLQFEEYTEIPMNSAIPYLQASNTFFVDHASGFIYFNGLISKQYTVYIPYQADMGDIAASTTWLNIPSRFHMILAFDVASMYRRGVDYDDISVRNAEENEKNAAKLFDDMCKWDDSLQRSSTTRRDMPPLGGQGAHFNHQIPV